MKPWVFPFLLALGGVISDYATTLVGLNMGFCETNSQYHPARALLVFWAALTLVSLALPQSRFRRIAAYGVVLGSYLGTANNSLLILGSLFAL